MSETLPTFEDERFQRALAEARAAERVRRILGEPPAEQPPVYLSIFEPARQRAQFISQLVTQESL